MKKYYLPTKIIVLLSASLLVLNLTLSCKSYKQRKAEKKTGEVCVKVCKLLPDPGECKAFFPRYYFDKEEGICKEFIWGGCNGVVPFNTLEECEACECHKIL